jgi:hypothetical protein
MVPCHGGAACDFWQHDCDARRAEWGEARLGEGSRAHRNYKKLLMMSEHDSEKVSSEIAEIESGEKKRSR